MGNNNTVKKKLELKYNFIGMDQYGSTYLIKKYPRKELLERLDRKHANKMHIDSRDGTSRHIGYVIAELWIEVLRLSPAFS